VPRSLVTCIPAGACAQQGRGLHPSLARATVRDIMLGRDAADAAPASSFDPDTTAAQDNAREASTEGADAAFAAACSGAESPLSAARVDGILRMDACFLEGLQQDADLYIRGRYAANVAAALARAPPRVHAVLLRDGPLGAPVPWEG
jgi:hypothetical protein